MSDQNMQPPSTRIGIDAPLLNALVTAFQLKNDSQLAELLGVSRTSLHAIRHKEVRLGKKNRIKILDKVAFLGITDWSERFKNSYLLERMRAISGSASEAASESAEFVDRMKQLFNCTTDNELSEVLGIRPSTLSMYRAGRTTLGEMPLLRVLSKVDNLDYKLLKIALTHSSFMISLLEPLISSSAEVKKA
jgi:transcriptional regulator with XRE-family HTH domain